jgi:hypothetical protein
LTYSGTRVRYFLGYGAEVAGREDGVGGQVGELAMVDDVAHAAAGDVGLEVVLDRRDGRWRLGHAVGDELGELLFEQFVLGLEARDEAEDLFQNLAQGEAAVHGGGLAQLVEGVVLLGLVEDLAVDVVDHAVPLAGLDGGGDEVGFSRTVSSKLRRTCGRSSCPRADGLLLDVARDVGAEVLVGAFVHDRPGAAIAVARLGRRAAAV